MKKCKVCGIEKELSEFYGQKKSSKTKGEYIYYPPYCKECTKKSAAEWVENNRERHNQNQLKYFMTDKGREAKNRENATWRNKGGQRKLYNKNKERYKVYAQNRNLHKSHEISKEEWEACKQYFDNECAYCGISENDASEAYGQKLHKEHLVNDGANDLSNCVPACRKCNSEKNTLEFEFWYINRCKGYSEERLSKIQKWISGEYKLYFIRKERLI